MMDKIKTIFTAFTSAFFSFFGLLAIPILLLVSANITDYITGLMAAKYRGKSWDSKVGVKGIFKKIGMWFLVLVGFMMDILISYSVSQLGIELPINCLVACVVAIWIVCNEFISILENLSDMHVNLPPFLQPLIENIRKQTEEKITLNNEKGSESNDKK